MPAYRATSFAGLGLKTVVRLYKKVDFRLEGYVMQPFQEIESNTNLDAFYGQKLSNQYFVGTSALIYQSPLGPISLSLSYYDHKENPYSLLFSMGYIIFTKRSLD